MSNLPDIVYVDNEPTEFMSLATVGQRSRFDAFTYADDEVPDGALAAAKAAGLWLFDFFLVEHQKDADDENGLSLFQKWRAEVGGARPATVLVSNDLENAIGEPIGPVERHHVVAQRHGVEWVGDKSKETLRRTLEMADGIALIAGALKPQGDGSTGTYNIGQLTFDILGAPQSADWGNSAQRQVDRARPPRQVPVITSAATARAIMGWLLTHVLPYPSFLLTDAQAALRLQVTPASFRALLEKADGTDAQQMLSACLYQGPAASFHGRRWWRAAIDDLAWKLSQNPEGYRKGLESLAGTGELDWLPQSEPVLVFTDDLVETDEVAEANGCVRVTDEDFPANIDPAWVKIAAARDNRKLHAKVVYEDIDLLEGPL